MNKKNIFYIVLITILSISLLGCGTDSADGSIGSVDLSVQENETEDSNNPETVEKPENIPKPSVQENNTRANVKIIKDDRPIKDSNGRWVVDRYYEKVVLEESNSKFKAINNLIQNDCDAFFAEHSELDSTDFDNDPWLPMAPEPIGEDDRYFYFSHADVKTNNDGILSIMLEQDWCMGGVRDTSYHGLNYNLNTGTEMKLPEVFSISEIQILDYLREQTIEYIDENFTGLEESDIQDAKQIIYDYSISDFEFYIEGKNICLCYYELVPASDAIVVKCPII